MGIPIDTTATDITITIDIIDTGAITIRNSDRFDDRALLRQAISWRSHVVCVAWPYEMSTLKADKRWCGCFVRRSANSGHFAIQPITSSARAHRRRNGACGRYWAGVLFIS
jgi:hypothetical protein